MKRYPVKATEQLFYGLERKKEGDEFYINSLMEFSEIAMEFVDGEDLEEFLLKSDEILGVKKEIMKATKDAPLAPVNPSKKAKAPEKKGLGQIQKENAPSKSKNVI